MLDSPSILIASELFLSAAYTNEDKVPVWLMAALKTPNNPVVIDNVIISTNFADLYGEEDEVVTPPSWDRSAYKHILRKDTAKKTISHTDEMLISFVDVHRQFRADFTFHLVLMTDDTGVRAIDLLDLDILSVILDQQSDDFMINWFLQRRLDVDSYVNRFRAISPCLKIVVDNS